MSNVIDLSFMNKLIEQGNADGQGYTYVSDIFPDKSIAKWVRIRPVGVNFIKGSTNPVFTYTKYEIELMIRIDDFKNSLSFRNTMNSYFTNYLNNYLLPYELESFQFVYGQYEGNVIGYTLTIVK